MPWCCVERSQLLRDILGSSEVPGDARLPVSTVSIRAWIQYVSNSDFEAWTDQRRSIALASFHADGGFAPDFAREYLKELLGLYVVRCCSSCLLFYNAVSPDVLESGPARH